MVRKCIVVKRRGSKKCKLSQKTSIERTKIEGEIYKFCGNRGKFIHFVEIIGLEGMYAPEQITVADLPRSVPNRLEPAITALCGKRACEETSMSQYW